MFIYKEQVSTLLFLLLSEGKNLFCSPLTEYDLFFFSFFDDPFSFEEPPQASKASILYRSAWSLKIVSSSHTLVKSWFSAYSLPVTIWALQSAFCFSLLLHSPFIFFLQHTFKFFPEGLKCWSGWDVQPVPAPMFSCSSGAFGSAAGYPDETYQYFCPLALRNAASCSYEMFCMFFTLFAVFWPLARWFFYFYLWSCLFFGQSSSSPLQVPVELPPQLLSAHLLSVCSLNCLQFLPQQRPAEVIQAGQEDFWGNQYEKCSSPFAWKKIFWCSLWHQINSL